MGNHQAPLKNALNEVPAQAPPMSTDQAALINTCQKPDNERVALQEQQRALETNVRSGKTFEELNKPLDIPEN